MRILIIHIAIFLLISDLLSQDNPVVNQIHFDGNKRTKSMFLQRFLSMEEEDKYDSLIVAEDMRRLRTLSSVLAVETSISLSDSNTLLIYTIEERWTLLPVGDFGFTLDNLWVGAGLMETNLFGRGVYVYGYLQYQTPFAAHFILRNPYLFGSKIGYEFQYKHTESPELNDYLQYDTYNKEEYSIAGKFELKYEKDFLVGISRTNENILNENKLVDKKKAYNIFFETRLQKMDYKYFMQDGWQNFFYINKTMPITEQKQTYSIFNDLRIFKTRGKINLASRFLAGYSTETNYFYLPYLVDSYKNFRGSGNNVARINRIMATNLEFRLTLYESKRSGIQLVAFSDIGITGYKASKTNSSNQTLIYAGAGSRFIFKKIHNAVLSVDYGIDMYNPFTGGLVVGWGQYF